jgi:hypothetical protein
MTFVKVFRENNPLEEKCSLCTRDRKFSIRRIKTGEWLFVCGPHDNFIGTENLMSLGYSRKDAITLNKEVKTQLPDLFREEDERG